MSCGMFDMIVCCGLGCGERRGVGASALMPAVANEDTFYEELAQPEKFPMCMLVLSVIKWIFDCFSIVWLSMWRGGHAKMTFSLTNICVLL
jgi:hypothetical protein